MTHRRRQNLYALPTSQWRILSEPPISILDSLNAVDDAIDHNAEIAEAILAQGLLAFGLSADPVRGSLTDWRDTAKPRDVAKAHSTIRQFYRDWSEEGKNERRACNDLALRYLELKVEDPYASRALSGIPPKILVPGAGLGRLAFDLALKGYDVEGNEISYHQLLASNWILNHTHKKDSYALYPFASQFTNVVSRQNQLQQVLLPDVHPGQTFANQSKRAMPFGQMDMTAADFVVLYSDPKQQDIVDAVITVFFIDTAPDLVRYIKTIQNCLKAGGVWINVGPLLWHFDDRAPKNDNEEKEGWRKENGDSNDKGIGEPGSFELTNDEVLLLVEKMGFKIEDHGLQSDGIGYMQDPHSMIQNLYAVSHWVARKLS